MKLIHKNNFWSVFCQAFTVVALSGAILDIISRKSINYSQFNLLMIAVACTVAIFILSQTYRFDALSPLAAAVLQYLAASASILFITWLTGFWEPVSPHGYQDMLISFSIPYVIGMVLYFRKRKREIIRQNETLQDIKKELADFRKKQTEVS